MSGERQSQRDAMDRMRGHLVEQGVPNKRAAEIARESALRYDGDRAPSRPKDQQPHSTR